MLNLQTLGATAEPVSLAPSLANFKVPELLITWILVTTRNILFRMMTQPTWPTG